MRTGPDRAESLAVRQPAELTAGPSRIAERTIRHVMAVRVLLLACLHGSAACMLTKFCCLHASMTV